MIRNNYTYSGKRKTNCTQISTTITEIISKGVDFSGGNTQPIYPKDENQTFDIFRDSDYLFKDYDPVKLATQNNQGSLSNENADNINPLIEHHDSE